MTRKYKIKRIMKPGKGTIGTESFSICIPKKLIDDGSICKDSYYEPILLDKDMIIFRRTKS